MNILFLSLIDFESIRQKGIYTDLLQQMEQMGHCIYAVSPFERRKGGTTRLISEGERVKILKVKIGNTQKTNLLEKGISTILLEHQIKTAIKKRFGEITFDMVLYSTPPITFEKVISYVKRKDSKKQTVSYLMLKDIFPQNAVDLGMFGKKSPFYFYFRRKEQKLYQISDYIGCMSPENARYLLAHNPGVKKERVELCPNAMRFAGKENAEERRNASWQAEEVKNKKEKLRKQYEITHPGCIFVYGGNLGKPQDVSYIIRCLKVNEGKSDRFFFICGNGTDAGRLKEYYQSVKGKADCNFKYVEELPRDAYDELLQLADAGLIFLDYRFTIPNFPSRLLSYMEAGLPVLAATDRSTDIGRVIEKGGFGAWCESSRVENFTKLLDEFLLEGEEQAKLQGKRAKEYLRKHFDVAVYADRIIKKCEKTDKING